MMHFLFDGAGVREKDYNDCLLNQKEMNFH